MATLAVRVDRPPLTAIGLKRSEIFALAALAATFALQLYLAFAKAINWDEFYHYSLIQRHAQGEDVQWLQTPFVGLFAWVPALPGDGILHIRLIRALTLAFELVTCAAVYGIGRRFSDRPAALFCTLAYATGGWVFLHAFALRADMIAAALLASALYLAVRRKPQAVDLAGIGLLLALATAATIKSVLWAPAFLGAVLLHARSAGVRAPFPRAPIVAAAGALLLMFGALAILAPTMLQEAFALARASAERLFSAGILPQGKYLLSQIGLAPGLAVVVALAVATLARSGLEIREKLALVCLLAPLLSVLLYRNSFPYFYAFILPPVAAACAPAAERLIERYRLVPLCLLLLVNAAVLVALQDRTVPRAQRQVLAGVHAIFDRPVTYIDEAGMITDFPRAIPRFSTGWALENYWAKGKPAYSEALRQQPVPMMLLNSHTLQNVFEDTDIDEHLLPQDEEVLRANYIPHWGPVYVAGKRIAAGAAPVRIDVAVPGSYTVEAEAITIGGRRYARGDLVVLGRGQVAIGGGRTTESVLRWGNHLPRPAFPAPDGALFTNY